MHEIIAKIARFAVSKFAAFCYAVAVGVAGNLIFHFVQPRDPAPSVAPIVSPIVAPGGVATAPHEAPPAAGAVSVSLPAAPTAPQADTAPAPARASQPAASKPAAASASLPQPPAIVALPSPASMPTPVLKPTALPAMAPATAPGEAAPTPAALPPIGPAIEVATPPIPPAPSNALAAPVAALPAPTAEATSKDAPNGLELSDVWHPYRAVKKGLHWAGEQVPLIGDGDGNAAPHPGPAAPSAPISLLPAAKPATPENAEASIPPPKPAAPGPGSGGLY